jgi:anti-sigma B factor antagonist
MTPEPRFPVRMIGDVPVVAVPEEIDITNSDGLRTALAEAATNGRGRFVVDMTRTQFCDTAGLHALVAAHKRTQTESGRMVLVMPGAGVLRIFEITGLDNVIPHVTSLEEALAQTR